MPRYAFHALFLDFHLLVLTAILSLLGFGIVIAILIIYRQVALNKQMLLWAVNLILFAWVTIHMAALGMLEWDSWW
jgi:hypothetical protein